MKMSPSASLPQRKVTSAAFRQPALAKILSLCSARPLLDFIAFAMNGKNIGFEKVLNSTEGMVATMKKEQVDDGAKMEYVKNHLAATDGSLS